jgi:superfamily I DNA/RNA helicase
MDLEWNKRKKPSAAKIDAVARQLERARQGDGSSLADFLQEVTRTGHLRKTVPVFVKAMREAREFRTAASVMLAHGRLRFDDVRAKEEQALLFDDLRASRPPKGLVGYDAPEGSTVVLNYHKAKGREFDAVIMVIEPRQESNKMPLDEQRRLYYVCATRARKHLSVIYYRKDLGRVLGPVLAPARPGEMPS